MFNWFYVGICGQYIGSINTATEINIIIRRYLGKLTLMTGFIQNE